MNKDILNSLKPGEQIIDLQEYFYGKNGEKVAYQMVIYTRKKFLWVDKFKKVVIPFFFDSKELAKEFASYLKVFYITEQTYKSNKKWYILKIKDKKTPYKHTYYFCDSLTNHTIPGSIWDGKINCAHSNYQTLLYSIHNINYKEVLNIEKENTFGETFTYKLTEE